MNHRIHFFRRPGLLGICLIGLGIWSGCSEDPAILSNTPAVNSTEQVSWAGSGAEELTLEVLTRQYGQPAGIVEPDGSIQAAVDAAKPGDVIVIQPGTYMEAVTVNTPGLKLLGLGNPKDNGVTIINPGEEEDGILVTGEGDGFELANVLVKDFQENGVLLEQVDGFCLFKVITIDDGEYGLFPVHCTNGRISQCEASGHSDTGVYVGQSEDVTIDHCLAFGNVNGFEIENCSNVVATQNEAFNNTAGILVVLLPFLEVKTSAGIEVSKNSFHDNNLPNFADPGELEAAVPSGSGILIVGTDRTLVSKNRVTGNDFVGIGVASTLVLGTLAGIPPELILADIEPFPDGVEVRKNEVTGNGGNPPPLPFPGVDLLWDGSGTDNCWSENTFDSSFPELLPACPAL